MDIKDIEIFKMIVHHGNLTKVAKELNYVQSNITNKLSKIEKEVGKELVIRTNKGVILTAEGKIFSEYVDRMLQLYREMLDTMKHSDELSGQLNIGATDITTVARLPNVLSSYLGSYPQVEFTLTNGSSKDLVKDVLEYKVDGAFITDFVYGDKLTYETLIEEEVVLISSINHPPINSLKDLEVGHVLVFQKGCTYRRKLEEWMNKEGVFAVKVSFGTIEGMIGCVKAGFGVALVSKLIAEQLNNDQKIQFHKVPEEYKYVKTIFIRRKNIPTSRTLDKFLDITRNVFEDS